MDNNANPRIKIINYALSIEFSISKILGHLLDISTETSKTLSNKSTALSFKTKIDLLTDIRALDKNDVIKFDLFFQIRNQFVHNVGAISYASCVSYINGLDKKLLKDYPHQDKTCSIEIQLEYSINRLFEDLTNSIHNLYAHILKKEYQAGYRNGRNEGLELVNESLNEICDELDNGAELFNKIHERAELKAIDRKGDKDQGNLHVS